jgi:hypothetical protein
MEKVLFVAKSPSIVERYYDGPYVFLDFDDMGAILRDEDHPVRKERIRLGFILIDHSELPTAAHLESLGGLYENLDKIMLLFFGRNIFFPYIVLTNEKGLNVNRSDVMGATGLESHLLTYSEGLLQRIVSGFAGSSMSR